jgi:small redox-active disulfide protein 2
MKVKILGPGCYRCTITEERVRQVLQELKADAQVEHITSFVEIWKYGVMATPAVVIDDKVVCQGRVPSVKEIRSWFEKK